jgi:hypothetical protein
MGYVSFFTGLENVLETMVNVRRGGPPASLNSADLPVAWVELPSGDIAHVAFGDGRWATYNATVFLAYQAAAQDTVSAAFQAGLGWLDTLARVLSSADVCASRLTVNMKLVMVTVAGTDFWAVRADVSGKDE